MMYIKKATYAGKVQSKPQNLQEKEKREMKQKKTKQQFNYKREGRESLVVSPQAWDQSNRVP